MNKTSKNTLGFTITELIIASGLSAFCALGCLVLLNFYVSRTLQATVKVQDRIDAALANQVIFDDLAAAMPSFGNLTTKDDSQKEFFEYYQGTPGSKLVAQGPRSVTLKAATGGSFEFVTVTPKSEGARYFPAQAAYEVAGSLLTYVDINKSGFFGKNYPKSWGNGKYFFFYSPSAIKPMLQANSVVPVRYYSMIGYSAGSNFAIDFVGGNWKKSHPMLPTVQITNPDLFFRYLPSIGGSMSSVLTMPASIVRYRLEQSPNGISSNLFRSVKSGNQYVDETLYATKVKSIKFSRAHVGSTVIEFKLELL